MTVQDLLNKSRWHVSLHHLVFCGLNCFFSHLQHTSRFILSSLAAAWRRKLFFHGSTINSLKGEWVYQFAPISAMHAYHIFEEKSSGCVWLALSVFLFYMFFQKHILHAQLQIFAQFSSEFSKSLLNNTQPTQASMRPPSQADRHIHLCPDPLCHVAFLCPLYPELTLTLT